MVIINREHEYQGPYGASETLNLRNITCIIQKREGEPGEERGELYNIEKSVNDKNNASIIRDDASKEKKKTNKNKKKE